MPVALGYTSRNALGRNTPGLCRARKIVKPVQLTVACPESKRVPQLAACEKVGTSQIYQEHREVRVIDARAKQAPGILDLGNDPLNTFLPPRRLIDLLEDPLQVGDRKSLTQYLGDPLLRIAINALHSHLGAYRCQARMPRLRS
jgi:hypothetical protein